EIADEATLKAAAFGELAVKKISELLMCYDLSDIYCCDEVGFPLKADLHNIDIIRMPRGQAFKHPLALGIAKAFRVFYTEKMLKVTYSICDRQSKSSEKVKNSTLWSYFATSWDNVSIPSIRYCFSRSPVMPAPHKTHLNRLTLRSTRFITELETMLEKTYKNPDDYDLCYYFTSINANTPESYMHDSTMEAIHNTTGLKERDDQDFVDEDDVVDFDEQ
ncbi:hypothetical protein BGZ46_007626, partial [Entomortierella lignicola]